MADRCYPHRARRCTKCKDPAPCATKAELVLGPVEDDLTEAQWLGWG